MNLDAFTLPFFFIWSIAVILVCLRTELSSVWKTSILLIFSFYILLFWPDLAKAWGRYSVRYSRELLRLLQALIKLLPWIILLLWPVSLWAAYKTQSPRRLEKIMRTMILITLFYWLFWLGDRYLHIGPKGWSANSILKKVQMIKLPKF